MDKKDFFSDLKKPKPRLDGGEAAPAPAAPAPGPQGRRPLDKQTLMELYESEERRKAERIVLDLAWDHYPDASSIRLWRGNLIIRLEDIL